MYASCLTLAEVTDGTAGDVAVRRAVKAVRLVDVGAEIGCRAGQLRAVAAASRRKHRDLPVDAVVAATALTLPMPVVVLTSDAEDLRLLLAGENVRDRSHLNRRSDRPSAALKTRRGRTHSAGRENRDPGRTFHPRVRGSIPSGPSSGFSGATDEDSAEAAAHHAGRG